MTLIVKLITPPKLILKYDNETRFFVKGGTIFLIYLKAVETMTRRVSGHLFNWEMSVFSSSSDVMGQQQTVARISGCPFLFDDLSPPPLSLSLSFSLTQWLTFAGFYSNPVPSFTILFGWCVTPQMLRIYPSLKPVLEPLKITFEYKHISLQ